MSQEKRIDTSRLNHTFNSSVEKENLKSSRSIHKIKAKGKPMSLSKGSMSSIKKSKYEEEVTSPPRQKETIETLHTMIEELLDAKKQPSSSKPDVLLTLPPDQYLSPSPLKLSSETK